MQTFTSCAAVAGRCRGSQDLGGWGPGVLTGQLGQERPQRRQHVVAAVDEQVVAGLELDDVSICGLGSEAVTTGGPPRRLGALPLVPAGVDGQGRCADVGVGMPEAFRAWTNGAQAVAEHLSTTEPSGWVSTEVRITASRAGPRMSSGSREWTKST